MLCISLAGLILRDSLCAVKRGLFYGAVGYKTSAVTFFERRNTRGLGMGGTRDF